MRRLIFIIILFVSLTIFSVTLGMAAELKIDGAIIQAFRMDGNMEITTIPAEVYIKPENLEKLSAGQSVITFIELPPGYNVFDIDTTTIWLCLGSVPGSGEITFDGTKPKIGDHDGDGVSDLKITFGRAEVLILVHDVHPPETVTFTVYGNIGNYIFAGSDTIKLVGPKGS